MNKQERLEKWIATLSEEQKNRILLDLTVFAIDSEYVNFYESTLVPYYDADGETLDGSPAYEEN